MEEIVFTNSDAENLYASCMDVQRLDWTLQQEIQLAKLITKLRNWIKPVTESKEKKVKSLQFINNGGSYSPLSKLTQEEREQRILDLSAEFEKVNTEKFEQFEELSGMIPLPLFTEEKIEKSGIKFTNCSLKQYFIEFCIKKNEGT